MPSISFQYPFWFLLICLALGGLFSFILYFRDKKYKHLSKWKKSILAGLRFLSISLISMLLLTPLLKSVVNQTQKTVVVFAQDVSQSVAYNQSETDLQAMNKKLKDLKKSLSQSYDVRAYNFGSNVGVGLKDTFDGKSTDISSVIRQIGDLHGHENLGAVIFSSDGIFNEGTNPIYELDRINAPIYSIGLGDTTIQKDLLLQKVFHNNIAYLGDKFTIQVDVAGKSLSNQVSKIKIYQLNGTGKTRRESKPLLIKSTDYFETFEFILEAKHVGVQHYVVELEAVEGEVSIKNNKKDFYIDIIDGRQKITIIGNAPHPDIFALTQVFKTAKNYEVEVKFMGNDIGSLNDADLVIFHNLPSSKFKIDLLLDDLNRRNISRLFIVGNEVDIDGFNTTQNLVSISGNNGSMNNVQTRVNNGFGLFNIEEEWSNQLATYLPLSVPFGEFKVGTRTEVLLYQNIGKVETKYPLLSFNKGTNPKVGVLCGEGIWRMRMYDYLENSNHNILDGLIQKSVQFLTVKEDKRKFKVLANQQLYNENEPIFFNAELYNNTYELSNKEEVKLEVKNTEGNAYDYVFSRKNNAYYLDAGKLPVGDYQFTATVVNRADIPSFKGNFKVKALQLELYQTRADHNLLFQMSEKSGGKLVQLNNIQSIEELINNNPAIKPIMYQTTLSKPVINIRWLFGVFAFILLIEWFLRRYFGVY